MKAWKRLQAWAEADRVKTAEYGGTWARMRGELGPDLADAGREFRTDMGKLMDEAREARAETHTTRHRIGAGTHSIHAALTVCTCGAWAPVWLLHALLKRGKSTTR